MTNARRLGGLMSETPVATRSDFYLRDGDLGEDKGDRRA